MGKAGCGISVEAVIVTIPDGYMYADVIVYYKKFRIY